MTRVCVCMFLGMTALAKYCHNLEEVDVSGCVGIYGPGLLALGERVLNHNSKSVRNTTSLRLVIGGMYINTLEYYANTCTCKCDHVP